MGGKAFERIISGAPINVPRLSPNTYQQIAANITSKLRTLFTRVAIPREAPAKADYGDIDFLVDGIHAPNNGSNIWTAVKAVLGAEFHVDYSFAVPHPQVTGAYVQVDVELSKDGVFEWTKFMKSDSDLLQIIGVLHRSLGIVCNDRGLHIRVEEVEVYHKKKSMLFLTSDPDEAMDFYGYDKAKYHQGFANETELFDWATSGRFFYWKLYEDREESSNDRARQRKRPMFNRFIDGYMVKSGKATLVPKGTDNANSPEVNQAAPNRPSRQDVLEEALRTFDKKEYDAMMVEHETKGIEEALWFRITSSIPQPQGKVIAGLKKWVDFQDGRPYIRQQPLGKNSKLKWTEHFPKEATSDVLAWVAENKEQVRKLEEDRAEEARKAAMK